LVRLALSFGFLRGLGGVLSAARIVRSSRAADSSFVYLPPLTGLLLMPRFPNKAEIDAIEATMQPYFLALGKVAHSWNLLHEELGKVFCAVTRLDQSVGMASWHRIRSDRNQREMLQGAIEGKAADEDWVEENPDALAGVTWLLEKVDKLATDRNTAVHAPCHALPGHEFEIVPLTFFGNRLAQRLLAKDILKEFDWYERRADSLRRHATAVRFALDARSSWPDKPVPPERAA
jgi:hypothetical protein